MATMLGQRTTPITDLGREFVLAFGDYEFDGTIGSCETAKLALDRYVDALRMQGQAPEQVVISVKRLANLALYSDSVRVQRGSAYDRTQRFDRFVSRSIVRYFGIAAEYRHDVTAPR